MTSVMSIISALAILVSCKKYEHSNSGLDFDNNNSVTSKPVISASFEGTTYPHIFETAF